ncbi:MULTISPECIES: hypothetical protein [Bradyrhizobium]|uniref:hypothetical protein n=1 Tax=Bradyrhizobium TaxID=374 RepID=UPI0012FA8F7D|nr:MULTISPECIES: hypothetical protein [unclassified Bradyrhizobium]
MSNDGKSLARLPGWLTKAPDCFGFVARLVLYRTKLDLNSFAHGVSNFFARAVSSHLNVRDLTLGLSMIESLATSRVERPALERVKTI